MDFSCASDILITGNKMFIFRFLEVGRKQNMKTSTQQQQFSPDFLSFLRREGLIFNPPFRNLFILVDFSPAFSNPPTRLELNFSLTFLNYTLKMSSDFE